MLKKKKPCMVQQKIFGHQHAEIANLYGDEQVYLHDVFVKPQSLKVRECPTCSDVSLTMGEPPPIDS
jgi:hypothetical protein